MPTQWTDTTERQLLLAIIHLTAAPRPKWEEVAVLMGPDFTSESVRQHFNKLVKSCKKEFGDPATTPKATPAKPTPRKRAKANQTPDGAGKRKVEAAGIGGEEQDTPIKKQEVKKEEGDEDDQYGEDTIFN